MAQTPMDRGFEWEEEFGKRMGIDMTRGSGNQWYWRGDGDDAGFVFSLKHTDGKSFDITEADIEEIEEIALDMSAGTIWAMAIRIAGHSRRLVILDLEDFVSLVEEPRQLVTESKRDAKRRLAGEPQLFRERPDE